MIDDVFEGNEPSDGIIKLKPSSSLYESGGFDAKGRARASAHEAPAEVWRLEPHVCRSCFSRLVSRDPDAGLVMSGLDSTDARMYQCTNCGLEGLGRAPDVLCACGLKLRKATRLGRSSVVLSDAGIRCVANPEIRADFSSLFVALEVGVES